MKTKDILLIAAVVAGGYYVLKYKNGNPPISDGGYMAIGTVGIPQTTANSPVLPSSAASIVVAQALEKKYITKTPLSPDWTYKSPTTKENIAAIIAPSGSKNLFSDEVLSRIQRDINKR